MGYLRAGRGCWQGSPLNRSSWISGRGARLRPRFGAGARGEAGLRRPLKGSSPETELVLDMPNNKDRRRALEASARGTFPAW